MKKTEKVKYTDAPKEVDEALDYAIKHNLFITDFPPPEKLIFKQSKIKTTIALAKNVMDFFKQQAQKNNTKYQNMINAVLENYVRKFA